MEFITSGTKIKRVLSKFIGFIPKILSINFNCLLIKNVTNLTNIKKRKQKIAEAKVLK